MRRPGLAVALSLAALTIPSALFAQQHQYPQIPTNNVPGGRPAPPAPRPPFPPRPPRPVPLPTAHGSHHHDRDRPNYRASVRINGDRYLSAPVVQEAPPAPKVKPTKRPAGAPDVFDSYSTK